MSDTIGSICNKEDCKDTEYVCACVECEKINNSMVYCNQENEKQ